MAVGRGGTVLELEPGDVALWYLCTVHGSGPNSSRGDRRFYLNDYVIAENCDRGEWAFRGGSGLGVVGRSLHTRVKT